MVKHFIVEEGPAKGQIFDLAKDKEYLIGRDPDIVDFAIEDHTVSRKHAVLINEKDGLYIKDLSATNPILVNDQHIEKPHLLKEQDRVKIGNTTLLYSEKEILEKKKKEKEESPLETVLEDTKKIEEEEKTLYDTIFEEETEAELPFSMIGEYDFILKITSGPNAGAEFGMEKNKSYIIGKDPNICDIVFTDLSVSKKHAKITIDEESNVFIEDLLSKNGVILNSKKIEQKEKLLSQDIISLGTTSFIILDKKEATETIYSPVSLEYDEEKEYPKEYDEEPSAWKKEIIPSKYLIFGGSFLFLVFVIFLSFFSLFKSKQIEIVEKNPQKEIEIAIKKFSDVQFSFNPAGKKLFLTGHVLTQTDQKELIYAIQNIPFVKEVENNVIIDELIWKNINDLLDKNINWKKVSIHSPKAGKFVLTGYVSTQKEKEDLLDYINFHFSYIDKLEEKIAVENILKAEISSLLIANNLINLSFQLTDGAIVIAGRYAEKEKSKVEKVLDQIKKIQGIRYIKNLAIETTEAISRIDLTSKYTISGYATSDDIISVIVNNKIIKKGDSLDTMAVTQITKNMIYLEKDGLKYKINYKQ